MFVDSLSSLTCGCDTDSSATLVIAQAMYSRIAPLRAFLQLRVGSKLRARIPCRPRSRGSLIQRSRLPLSIACYKIRTGQISLPIWVKRAQNTKRKCFEYPLFVEKGAKHYSNATIDLRKYGSTCPGLRPSHRR